MLPSDKAKGGDLNNKITGCFMQRLTLCILFTALIGCSTTPEEPSGSDWSRTPDYGELRHSLGWSDDFIAKCEVNQPLREMVERMNADEWTAAAAIGSSWLDQCPVDMRAHFYTGIALAESGHEADAEHHFRWVDGLLDSIVSSGDGKSPETAYQTISISEGYDVLYFFGLRPKNQALVSSPVLVDQITATNEEGEEFSIFFNPAAHFDRLAKMLDVTE